MIVNFDEGTICFEAVVLIRAKIKLLREICVEAICRLAGFRSADVGFGKE